MNLRMKTAFTLTIIIALLWSVQGKSGLHEVVVAQDGSGNFTTITKAIEAAPNNSKVGYTIRIKAGIYAEYIIIEQRKTNLILIGDGMDTTVITGNRSATGDGLKTYYTATFGMHGDNFVAQGITFQNVAGLNMGQAVALMTEANHVAFYKCRFLGYQDTLYTKFGTQFFRECEIEGTVDVIFGNAAVLFQNCVITARKTLPGKPNTITAQGRERNNTTGTVLHNCTIKGADDISPKTKTYLGRPWKPFARTVIMQSDIGELIDPHGWSEWDNSSSTNNVYYAEYHNRGMGNDTRRRVSWARVLNNSHDAEEFTVRNFIQGDTWIPITIPYFLDLL